MSDTSGEKKALVPAGKGRGSGRGAGPVPGPSGQSRAMVPRGRGGMNPLEAAAANPIPFKKVGDMLVPEGYTMREVKPADKYDVVSFARAMNDDFAPKLKKLFDYETEAAVEAQKTGIYIGWRCPEFKHDCQRVNRKSRCFCDHLLDEHASYNGKSVRVPCKVGGCPCKAYSWIPNRPEDIGEFWFARRRNFDVTKWRAKCKCKHTHDFHDPNSRRCRTAGCGCGHFNSDFLCAACDRHYELHETFFDTEDSRRQQGLPVGQEWLPFAEMPDLRNIALTGHEEDDSRYLALTQGEGSIPQYVRPAGNDAVVNFGASGSRGGGGGSGFKPVYD
ncbi:protein FAM221B-like isoform X2 [Littorina saxatilis]|uniref:Protein FAM221B n=1 Tax=Littorina saxatilis TaxID=31220 RepID=A0AAN9C809_9CAEN